MKPTVITHSREETERFGADFAARLAPGDVVAFYGGLGAGKTAFIRGVLKALGAGEYIPSPTFNIVNEYRLPNLLAAHFDMYRVDDPGGLENLGFYDYLGRALLLIEWSEHIEAALDGTEYRIYIGGTGEEARTIRVEPPAGTEPGGEA